MQEVTIRARSENPSVQEFGGDHSAITSPFTALSRLGRPWGFRLTRCACPSEALHSGSFERTLPRKKTRRPEIFLSIYGMLRLGITRVGTVGEPCN